MDNSLVQEFAEWLRGQRIDERTIKYYVNTVMNARYGRDKQTRAWRKYVRFLNEQGLLSMLEMQEILERLKIRPSKKKGIAAVPTQKIMVYKQKLVENNMGWLHTLLLGGARLSHVTEMLQSWNPTETVVHSPGIIEPRLHCNKTFCRYYMGIEKGSKRCLYIYYPATTLEKTTISYTRTKDQLRRQGIEIGVYRDYATQQLERIATEHNIVHDAAKYILTRDLSITAEHYLNTRDWADKLFTLYVQWLQEQGLLLFSSNGVED